MASSIGFRHISHYGQWIFSFPGKKNKTQNTICVCVCKINGTNIVFFWTLSNYLSYSCWTLHRRASYDKIYYNYSLAFFFVIFQGISWKNSSPAIIMIIAMFLPYNVTYCECWLSNKQHTDTFVWNILFCIGFEKQ